MRTQAIGVSLSIPSSLGSHNSASQSETELIRGEVENFLGNWNLSTLLNSPNDNRFHLFEDKNEGQKLKLTKD
jgi:hypothetical protein